MKIGRKPDDEDLFEGSTMTFGEHLEELRICLVRAAMGLAVGVVIGFFLGRSVVHLIEQPLQKALGNYYTEQSVKSFDSWIPRDGSHATLPYSRTEVVDAVERKGFSFEMREVHPQQLALALAGTQHDPDMSTEQKDGSVPLKFDTESLVPIFLWQPLEKDSRVSITTLSAQEAFTIYIKAALLVGLVLSSPWVFYQLWTFVAAGLYSHEKQLVWTFLPVSIALFLAGVSLAFFFVFDFVLDYLLAFNQWLGLDPDPRISEWLSFVLILPIGFGIGFQLPLLMLFFARIGVFDAKSYASQWRTAIVVIFIVSAILTPADPYSMLFLAMPLCLLYFSGLAACFWTLPANDAE
ncbi:MAG: twin-arginine translocase subunit TatC [Pirellulales bacterium]